MAHVYGWLAEQSAEDSLHAERLLFVEERPFQRISRRLLGEDSIIRTSPRQLPSPPAEQDEADADAKGGKPERDDDNSAFSRRKFREDILVDFSALESSIARIQLIQLSNARERERYAAEKAKILASAQAVRENTLLLREQLVEAQRVLELRKGYDALATKILVDRKLKSRDEARLEIAALEKDIAELEAESKDADEVWNLRRQGFEEVVESGKIYLRAIKGIKEQPEAEDAMDEGDETVKHDGTGDTPGPDGSSTPRIDTRSATPLPETTEDTRDETATGDMLPPSKLRQSDVPDGSDEAVQDAAPIDTEMGDMPATTATSAIGTPLIDSQNDDASISLTDDTAAVETMDET